MAHFAKLDENNVVTKVVVVGNDIPTANGPLGENDMHPDGEAWCAQTLGGVWKQTSYNANFRNKFACKGNIYNSDLDIFTCAQPYSDFTLNPATGNWEGPVPAPNQFEYQFQGQIDEEGTIGTVTGIIIRISWNTAEQRWEGVDMAGDNHIWDPNTSTWS